MQTFLGIDYPTLWFIVVGALLSGYAILDGFDLGAGAWHLFFKEENSRRIALNAVGPVWDGNEVWLVIGGGVLFAGFPEAYATLFSAMYVPFILFLGFLIFRAVSIEFRGKESMKWWRKTWDICYSISSAMMTLLLGVVLGNVLIGISMNEQFVFTGNWLKFLNPYALLVGLTTLSLFMVHGAIYLAMKTEDKLLEQVTRLLRRSIPVFVFIFLVATELYPVVILDRGDMENSMTIYDAASSDKSLGIMLTIVLIGLPLVIAYTVFVYRTFRGKIKLDETSY